MAMLSFVVICLFAISWPSRHMISLGSYPLIWRLAGHLERRCMTSWISSRNLCHYFAPSGEVCTSLHCGWLHLSVRITSCIYKLVNMCWTGCFISSSLGGLGVAKCTHTVKINGLCQDTKFSNFFSVLVPPTYQSTYLEFPVSENFQWRW